MTKDNYQDDFFAEQFGEKKSKKLRLFDKYYKQRFLPHVRVPVEYVVIMAIGILVLAIVSYAVGVEMGKKFSIIENTVKEEIYDRPSAEREILVEKAQQEEKGTYPKHMPEEVVQEKSLDNFEKAPYIIQLATFREESSAKKEVEALKLKGVNAGMSKSDSWHQVYAEGYETIESAKKAKETFSKDYKDCYIRRRQ